MLAGDIIMDSLFMTLSVLLPLITFMLRYEHLQTQKPLAPPKLLC